MIACSSAHGDIFTWVDASGRINVSNVDPPEGVRVTNVQRTNPATAAAEQAAREAVRQAEVRTLEERVQQLQQQVNEAARQPPPQQHIEYHVVMAAPAPPYGGDWMPPPAFYDYPAPAPSYAGCDPSWFGCAYWWNPGIYPASILVAGSPRFGRHRPLRGGRPIATPGFRPIAPLGGGPIPPPLLRPITLPGGHIGRGPGGRTRH
jgi:hypothetical protein